MKLDNFQNLSCIINQTQVVKPTQYCIYTIAHKHGNVGIYQENVGWMEGLTSLSNLRPSSIWLDIKQGSIAMGS